MCENRRGGISKFLIKCRVLTPVFGGCDNSRSGNGEKIEFKLFVAGGLSCLPLGNFEGSKVHLEGRMALAIQFESQLFKDIVDR